MTELNTNASPALANVATPDAAQTDSAHKARFGHLDGLRAVAVLLVVVAHAGLGDVVPGGSGVTIFFAISGFIITHLLIRERRKTGGFAIVGFYRRRLVKLAPPVIAVVLIPTIVYAFFGTVNPWAVVSQLAFAYNWVHIYSSADHVLPGSQVLWSLAIEEQFYLLFAPLWVFLIRGRTPLKWVAYVAGLVVVASICAKLAVVLAPGPKEVLSAGSSNRRIYYGSDTRADALAIGVLAAVLQDWWTSREANGIPIGRLQSLVANPAAPIAAIVLFLLTLVYRDPFFRDVFRYGLQALATAVVILHGLQRTPSDTGLFSRFERSRALQTVGLASYSIYIVHFSLRAALEPLVEQAPAAVEVVVYIVVSVAAGYAAYRWIETPFQRFKYPRRGEIKA
ncbi:MAG: acyltransferase [Beijerinckiaceae bacterium]|nr:acyltransferase [Beijerinckiaceae bacterium]